VQKLVNSFAAVVVSGCASTPIVSIKDVETKTNLTNKPLDSVDPIFSFWLILFAVIVLWILLQDD
jgi:hypothetical protein